MLSDPRAAGGPQLKALVVAALLALVTLAPAAASAREVRGEAAWKLVATSGYVVLIRHATAPGTGDPARFKLGDCTTQRNLDATGRTEARRLGEAFRRRGIKVARVLSSEWCRCRETAELLGLGKVEERTFLNSLYHDPSKDRARTSELRRYISAIPAGELHVLVTHQFNISALTDTAVSSGEMIILRIDPKGGKHTIAGRIPVAQAR